MKIWATSDQHFTHFNIIKYANRPFELSNKGVKDCINTIVNKYNEVVQDDDIVIHVGDLGHGRNQSKENIGFILENLKGKKVLIRGNHDEWDDEYYLKYFHSVEEYYSKNGVFICHYPCYDSNRTRIEEHKYIDELKKYDIHTIIHGHVHNKNPDEWEPDGYKRINVSVDFTPNDFYPVDITNYFK